MAQRITEESGERRGLNSVKLSVNSVKLSG
jgi:hypothetical protein